LELGKSITVGEITLPDGVELVSPEPETTIFHIAIPRAEEEEETEGAVPVEGDEEGAGGEPEVITKSKKEENEEA